MHNARVASATRDLRLPSQLRRNAALSLVPSYRPTAWQTVARVRNRLDWTTAQWVRFENVTRRSRVQHYSQRLRNSFQSAS